MDGNNEVTPISHLPGITSSFVQTRRLRVHLLCRGATTGTPVIFIHGNFSSSTYFEEVMTSMPAEFRVLAVDLRGYGFTEDKVIDATRGARDWADDLHALFDSLDIASAHLVGWSAGAAAIMQFTQDHPALVKSLTLIAPVSPYGFGGTKGVIGSPCYDDFAGSGGGVVAPAFITRVIAGDRGTESPFSPRNLIRHTYLYQPKVLAREDALVTASLQQKLGEQHYPGDAIPSPNWPFVAPGKFGPLNAISAKYYRLDGFPDIAPKPPVLWIRGDKDCIIGNQSQTDLAVMGKQNLLPGWPGDQVYPPQPMLDQMRGLLSRYRGSGGYFQEVVMPGVGHSPFIEDQQQFLALFLPFITSWSK